jgi:hypothetical protein
MKNKKVNTLYRYNPAPMDKIDPPFGANSGELKEGDIVKTVNKTGCPKFGTMGHCYIEKDGRFMGMVCLDSLDEI